MGAARDETILNITESMQNRALGAGPLFDESSRVALDCAFCLCAYFIVSAETLSEHWRHLNSLQRAVLVIQARSLPSAFMLTGIAGAAFVVQWVENLDVPDNAKSLSDPAALSDALLDLEHQRLEEQRKAGIEKRKMLQKMDADKISGSEPRPRGTASDSRTAAESHAGYQRERETLSKALEARCRHCGATNQQYRLCRSCKRVR
ncbi:hypothetical protein [Cryobacterium sp. Hh38]|uniref:hypothetical protein n=1 Tax=Cryobacterium sp. Hh38 TaxID=1259156 RepID=UPI00106AB654|nr:hypothetical protein [Cryobacterium sp. Hh38]TFD66087.1 hypothetical protein E3T41_00070 [Cryobacterium sp. Hh38]